MGAIKELENYSKDVMTGLQRFLNDEELYLDCLMQFKEDANFLLLGQSLEQKNFKKAFEAAHNLKGAAGNLGLTPLFIALSNLVMKLRTEKYENLETEYELVLEEQSKLKEYLLIDTVDHVSTSHGKAV